MGSRALVLLKGASLSFFPKPQDFLSNTHSRFRQVRRWSTKSGSGSSLQPPDVPSLAETARISLTASEVEEFAPKIRQVVDWFGQLQDVDLESIEPSLRADTEDDNLRDDSPEVFNNREALIAGVPVFEEAYIKVPRVLNKE